MLLMTTIMMMSMLAMTNMSPIMMVIAIIILSSSLMAMTWMETSNPWMPLIFTLAFLGGMMIIFMYIISISSTKVKKNKNKLPVVFVFVTLGVWSLKYGSTTNMSSMIMSVFFTQYMLLCFMVLLILFIITKIINSPFKALKGAS